MWRPIRRAARTAFEALGIERQATAAWVTLRQPWRLWDEAIVWWDARRFARRHPFLSERPHARKRGRTLIISLSNFVAQVKAESLLAKALELRGYDAVPVTERRHRRARRIFSLFGYNDVVFFEEHVSADIPNQAARAIQDVLAGGPAFQTVRRFQYRGVDVGRQALATLLRGLHVGKLDFDHPSVRDVLQRSLEDGVRAVHAAERVLDLVRPDVALINDAQYIGVGALFESTLGRGIPVVQWVGSQRDDALALKRFDRETCRQHPFSLSDESWRAVAGRPWTDEHERELLRDFRDRYVEGRWDSYYNRNYGSLKAREDARRQLGLDPSRKTATVFAHILWDSTLFWGEDLFGDYQEWLIETVRVACQNRAVNWLVKLHPGNAWKLKRDGVAGEAIDRRVLREHFGELPAHVKLLEPDADFNTYSVFGLTDYCLTVRGTVGIEAAALGIPVLTAGTGRYAGLGFTVDSTSRAEYLERLKRIHEIPPLRPDQTELAKKYAHALFIRRPARFTTFRQRNLPLERLGHPLDHNVEVGVRSFAELERASDLAAFARWVLDTSDRDFLSPDHHDVRRELIAKS